MRKMESMLAKLLGKSIRLFDKPNEEEIALTQGALSYVPRGIEGKETGFYVGNRQLPLSNIADVFPISNVGVIFMRPKNYLGVQA